MPRSTVGLVGLAEVMNVSSALAWEAMRCSYGLSETPDQVRHLSLSLSLSLSHSLSLTF
jgi:hypothetical protein